MLAIGLTGGLASGKSTVASMFARLGAKVMDADRIAYEMTKPGGRCFKPIVKKFGKGILSKKRIDRRKLAAIVFADKNKLKQLERIVHPVVQNEIREKIQQEKRRGEHKLMVIEVPLLFESGINRDVDLTIVVKSKTSQQIQRAVNHIKITRQEARRRIQNQMPLTDKIRLADIIIDNSHSKQTTQKQVQRIWQKLLIRKKA